MYGVLENILLGEGGKSSQRGYFFKDPHIFPYYLSKCLRIYPADDFSSTYIN